MPSVYIEESKKRKQITLTFGEYASIIYHDMFDYPLTFDEVEEWSISEDYIFSLSHGEVKIKKVDYDKGYFYIGDEKNKLHKRLMRKESSDKKLQIAFKSANLLGMIPSILFVGITGSLAMENADDDSDIDLMIITSNNSLWLSRAVSLIFLLLFGFKIRRKNTSIQKDRICANIWIDENRLAWREKNIFTAHEIAQIKPLIDKKDTYRKFLNANKWVYDFFPNKLKNRFSASQKVFENPRKNNRMTALLNKMLFKLQTLYMGKSITKEKISIHRALFHPVPLSDYVEKSFIQSYLSVAKD